MNQRQLRIFLAVCDHGTTAAAAKQLYLSQPAVSKALRDLETSIGVALFDRQGNRLRLNQKGAAFRVQATALLRDYEQMAQFGARSRNQLPLRVGMSLTFGQATMPAAIARFQQAQPQVPLQLFAENVAQIQARLRRGEIDLALVEGTMDEAAYTSQRLSTYELWAVGAPPALGRLTLATVTKQRWLLREVGSTLRDRFEAALHRQGLQVQPWLESTNTTVLTNAAATGLGLTILPAPLALPLLKADRLVKVTLPKALALRTDNYAIMRQDGVQDMRRVMVRCFQAAESEKTM